jgi:peptide deformylase
MFLGVRFELLGPVRGWRDGRELQLGSPQQRTLLAMFLLAGGRQVPLEMILDGFWGEDVPKAAVGTVRTYVSRLRGCLETRSPQEREMPITSVGDGYVVDPDNFVLDVDVFQQRLAEARTARANQETAKAAQLMREALTLWHGIPLAGMPGPYADSRRRHLSDLCMAALEEKLALDVITGEHATAITELRALLRKQPFHEGLAETLMLALYKSSRQAEALVVFEDMRHRLRDNLGLDPGPAIQEMHQRILRADSRLFGPADPESRSPRADAGGSPPACLEAAMSVSCAPVYRKPGVHNRFPRAVSGAYQHCLSESLSLMTIRRIFIDGDPVLHTPTRPVATFDSALRELVSDMFDTMYASSGVGLAANQIGVAARVFVYDCPDAAGDWHTGTIVNPVLRASAPPERAPDPEADMEGCLSVPLEEGFPLVRAEWAIVAGTDAYGTAVEATGSGKLARCFQHETDHLNGHLYLDRLTGEYAVAALDVVATHGWGVPGNSWLPEAPGGEPTHVSRDIALRSGDKRGPISTDPVRIPDGTELRPVE